jgi:hypothetical protein
MLNFIARSRLRLGILLATMSLLCGGLSGYMFSEAAHAAPIQHKLAGPTSTTPSTQFPWCVENDGTNYPVDTVSTQTSVLCYSTRTDVDARLAQSVQLYTDYQYSDFNGHSVKAGSGEILYLVGYYTCKQLYNKYPGEYAHYGHAHMPDTWNDKISSVKVNDSTCTNDNFVDSYYGGDDIYCACLIMTDPGTNENFDNKITSQFSGY